MVIMIIAAVIGAALGVFVRPWIVAPVIAVTIGGGAQGGVIFVARLLAGEPGHEKLVETLGAIAGTSIVSLWPTLAASGVAALLAALLTAMAGGDEKEEKFWLPSDDLDSGRARDKDGRRRRLAGMVQERPAPTAAESRIGAILDL